MRKTPRRTPTLSLPTARTEPMERRVLFSFTPYVHDGVTATPGYQYLNRATGRASTAKPLGSTSPNGAPLTPATMRAAYGLGTIGSSNVTFNGVQGDGRGETIAIVDVGSDPTIASDLQAFDAYYNLPNPTFTQMSQTGSTTSLPSPVSGWIGEISLDVEWAHVMAPAAAIDLIASTDLYAGVQYAATIPGVACVSMSFGISGNSPDSDFLTPSGHTGVTFLAGSGDSGAGVSSPNQSPNVVSVGGTHLNLNNNAYGSETAWSGSGGGISSSESQPAYQSGVVSQYSTTQRTVPDVSIDADPGSGVAIYSAYDGGASTPWELIIGGTSLATPLWAGLVAVADQGRVAAGLTALDGSTQTLPRLYQLDQANAAGNFHDITSGSNGYAAGTGYDLVTGLGSPQANKLVPDLAGADTVSGRAFIDVNGNGTYDAGTDTPLANRTVYLDLTNSGAQTPADPTATTDANGLYSFADVIGSVTGTVRLAGTTGYLPETTGTFTTAYDTAQTDNLIFGSATTYAATASPTVTTKSTALGVTVTNGTAPSGLTYTWSAAITPANVTAPTFSANGTAAAASPTVTFHAAGTYTLAVKITNAAGGTATASVVVTVQQVLTSVSVVQPTGLTVGQSEQLSALGYDQFGGLIGAAPNVTWAVTAGGGTVTPGGTYTATVGTLATVSATYGSSVATGTVPVVNQPWTSADVGTVVAPAGTAYDQNNTTTLTNTSDDIWNASDDFHFDYQEVAGDVTITAKLASVVSNSSYVKAGLMIRNTLDPASAMADEFDPSPGPLFEWRTTAGGTAAQDATSGPTAPQWLRLVKSGTTLTGYSSTNGTTWTETGTETISFNTDVYVGLALSSHDTSNSATAVFSNVSIVPATAQTLTTVAVLPTPDNLTAGQPQQLTAVAYDQNGLPLVTQPSFTWTLTSGGGSITSAGVYTPPSTGTLATVKATAGSASATGTVAVVKSPWTSLDIGSVTTPGTAYDSATTTTLTDTSDDIWNQSDDFHFDYQTLTGNGTITAKLNSQTSNSSYIKAGLMIRNTLDSGSAMAAMFDPSPGPLFEWRTTEGGTAAQDATSTGATAPEWLRLTRTGNTVYGYASANGTTFTLIGSETIAMNATVYVGLALTSHDTGNSATAVFSNVSIANPTVATAAAASPSPVTGTTAALSVLGATPAGESTLTYAWAATTVPAGAAAPTFSANNTNAAKNTTATFTAAGNYVFTVTITDALGDAVTSTVAVTVSQTLTAISLTPATATVADGGTAQFTAAFADQFGNPLATTPAVTWTVDGGGAGGTVSSTGLYTAPATGSGTATVRATSGTVSGTAAVTVQSTVVSTINGTAGNDVIRLVRSGANLLVYVDNPTTPAYTLTYAALTSLTVLTGTGTDTVDVDYSGGGTPVPAGGLTVTGGGGTDTLIVTGTTGADTAVVTDTAVTVNRTSTTYGGFAAIVYDGDGGADSLTQANQPGNGASLTFNAGTAATGPSAADALAVNVGLYRFAAPAAGAGVNAIPLASLTIGGSAAVVVGSAATPTADRWVLDVGTLSVASAATLNLGTNDLIVTTGTLSAVAALAASGYAGGTWTGPGLSSSAAAADPAHLTAVGVIQNAAAGTGAAIYTTFDGVPVASSAVLARYTYYGDANLDGSVNAADYTLVDAGYVLGLTGWQNGDFNYDGVVDGTDYTLMDNAFDQQTGGVAAPAVVVAAARSVAPARGSHHTGH